jgi:hypothetical protein
MTAAPGEDVRAQALEAFLVQSAEDGYRIETRSQLQAVIYRRNRLHHALRWVSRGDAQQRLVVSVDQHGEVTSVLAEPMRW